MTVKSKCEQCTGSVGKESKCELCTGRCGQEQDASRIYRSPILHTFKRVAIGSSDEDGRDGDTDVRAAHGDGAGAVVVVKTP